MPKFKVCLARTRKVHEVTGCVEIEADSQEQANQQAKHMPMRAFGRWRIEGVEAGGTFPVAKQFIRRPWGGGR